MSKGLKLPSGRVAEKILTKPISEPRAPCQLALSKNGTQLLQGLGLTFLAVKPADPPAASTVCLSRRLIDMSLLRFNLGP